MHFDLTDDQKLVREQLKALLADRLGDRKLLALYNAPDSFDDGLWAALAEMGLAGVLVPERAGGLGLDLLTLAVIAECLGESGAPVPLVANALGGWLLAETGGHDDLVAGLLSGKQSVAFALAAPHGWSQKDWVLEAPTISADVGSVEWARRADAFVIGLAGGRLGLVRRSESVEVADVPTVDRTRPMSRIKFKRTHVEALDAAPPLVDRLLNALYITTAADARGAAKTAIDRAIGYAGVRKQFGKLIGQFQGLKYQLVEMAITVEPCQPLVWYAAHAWDAIPDKVDRAAATAKAHVTDVAVTAARAAVEAHGGIGYTWEYPLHIWLKRAMHDRAMFGRPQIHRMRAADLAGW